MAERNRESVAAKSRGLWKRVAPLLVLTAEISGLATFAGAVFSIIFNSIAFQAMGLNFVEIATPSDLLMSGIKLTGTLLLVIGVSLAGSVPIYLFFRYFWFIRDAKPPVWQVLFAVALLVFLLGAFLDAAPLAGLYPDIPYGIEQTALLAYFPLLALAWLVRRAVSSQWRIAALVTIIAAVAIRFSGTIYDSYSFARSNLLVRFEDGEEACGGPSRAIWIGTSSVVTECASLVVNRPISVVERSTVEILPREDYFARRGVVLFAARRYFDPFKERDWRQIESVRDKLSGRTVAYPTFLDISDVVRDGSAATVWVGFDIRAFDSEGPVVIDVAVQCDMDSIQPRAVFLREAGFMRAAPPSDILGANRALPKSIADVACRTDLPTLPKSDFAVPRTLGYPDRQAAQSANEM